jgi:hypothetical protein
MTFSRIWSIRKKEIKKERKNESFFHIYEAVLLEGILFYVKRFGESSSGSYRSPNTPTAETANSNLSTPTDRRGSTK